ncbi:MAG: GGDEF domain-containing protein [Butyrivibrio sp.]|nr:GGDEF domain-containing protein [Butyrivibrio sp.]
MIGDKTDIILDLESEQTDVQKMSPRLFVCQGSSIAEYRLEGKQVLGRPVENKEPDIAIQNRFVSRNHGLFETKKEKTVFRAVQTTNGILYMGKLLSPGESLNLTDGDEMIIPAGDERDGGDGFVLIVYASSHARINLWRGFRKASADQLTGLCKRDRFISWWEKNNWKNEYSEGVIFILDIDDFKIINDTRGHNVGDAALKHVAEEIRACVRYEDQICRWGGDEFVGIVPGPLAQAEKRLKELLRKIEVHDVESCPPILASVGYANISDSADKSNMEELVGMADKALYHIKKKGKRGICLYTLPKRDK